MMLDDDCVPDVGSLRQVSDLIPVLISPPPPPPPLPTPPPSSSCSSHSPILSFSLTFLASGSQNSQEFLSSNDQVKLQIQEFHSTSNVKEKPCFLLK